MRMAFMCSKWAVRTGVSHSFCSATRRKQYGYVKNRAKNNASHAASLAPDSSRDGFSSSSSWNTETGDFFPFLEYDLKYALFR